QIVGAYALASPIADLVVIALGQTEVVVLGAELLELGFCLQNLPSSVAMSLRVVDDPTVHHSLRFWQSADRHHPRSVHLVAQGEEIAKDHESGQLPFECCGS